MPHRPKHSCAKPGCPHLAPPRRAFCDDHQRQHNAKYDKERGSASKRGYGVNWRRIRSMYLSRNPFCSEPDCKALATEVDHIKPLSEGGTNEFENLRGFCKPHHSARHVKEGKRWG